MHVKTHNLGVCHERKSLSLSIEGGKDLQLITEQKMMAVSMEVGGQEKRQS